MSQNLVNVSATFNPDGWCTTVIVEGLSIEDMPDVIRLLVKPRPPRPHSDPAETVFMPLRTATPVGTHTFQ